MVTTKFRLIHNLNYNLRFAILEDVFNTPTWAEIERLGEAGKNTGWVYNYSEYMKRPEWQLFDIQKDPLGLQNLAYEKEYANVFSSMVNSLRAWRQETVDPWMPCNPAASGSTWADTHSEKCSF
jgi:N-sulfoglucosamine sulfohydrolase